jgi:AcrR family transcriptional regulator
MARPTTIDDQTILEAARTVFLERGFAATTAEVATRAGVSEGSVFKRFRTKELLFRTAMEKGAQDSSLEETLAARIGQGEMKEQLSSLLTGAIGHLRIVVPYVMLSWSNPGPSGVPQHLEPNPPAIRALRLLTSYFEAEMRLGRVRRQDPEILARSVMGAAWHYAQFECIFRTRELLPLPLETYVRGYVELIWPGMAPEPDDVSGSR